MKEIYTVYPSDKDDRAKRRDVNGTAAMIGDTVGPENNKSKFQLGRFTAPFWNVEDKMKKNNCYAYACNIRVDDDIPDPGYRKFGKVVENENEFRQGIEHDGLVEIIDGAGAIPPVQGTIENPAWIVAAFAGTDSENRFGYHFFRKVWSGNGPDCDQGNACYWSHKFFKDAVTNKRHNGDSPIQDCEDEMFRLNESNALEYHFVGYFLVKPDITIGAPPILHV